MREKLKLNKDRELKAKFFHKVAVRYLPEMRLVLRGGKLWKKEGWRNVVQHCLIQAAAAEVISEILGLPNSQKNKLARVAACHDWKKRIEKRPQDFTEEEKGKIDNLLSDRIDEKLFNALNPEFNIRFLKEGVSFLEKIQWYLDNITRHGEIVSLKERIDEVEARRQDLNEDPELTKKLGGRKYWEVSREIGRQIEKELFDIITKRGVIIKSPEEIPNLINKELLKRIYYGAEEN